MTIGSASSSDPFGFEQLQETVELDLSAFAPKAKGIDRQAAAAAAAVARDSGFTRRQPVAKSDRQPALSERDGPAERGKKRRVNISELLGLEDRYPETERAQLNMLVPVPVFLRWRKLVMEQQLPAWEVLEAALAVLEAQTTASPTSEASSHG